ncbi:MAG: hypothetical protein ACTSVI_01765 [Promethearchaeota archaeon]
MNTRLIDEFYETFDKENQQRIDQLVESIVKTKEENGKVIVVTGSGPNIHEGVTTLIAELIDKKIIDGVLTSSAVIAHEMGGALDKVKRVVARDLELNMEQEVWLPRGDIFELTIMSPETLEEISKEIDIDLDLIKMLENADGNVIIKAAGNMAYPMGLRTEILAEQILKLCENKFNRKFTLEHVAGLGADSRTMIGAGANNDVPVLVTIPQLVGGGAVGLSIADSISIHDRCLKNAKLLGEADIIIESGIALAQEIHDGPFETYTGHGIWAQWQKHYVYSLKNKIIARIDLDWNLDKAWKQERSSSLVQQAIAEGKPKTKLTGIPFRMEMSGFARLETSIPIIGDLGAAWPVIMSRVSKDLGIKLDFMSYKQETEEGKKMREFIVNDVKHVNKDKMEKRLEELD